MLDNSFGAGKHAFPFSTCYSACDKVLLDKLGRKIWKFNLKRSVINEKEVLKVTFANLYHYDETPSNLWSCNAEIELNVTDRSGETVTRTMEHCFTNRSRGLDFDGIMFRNVVFPENNEDEGHVFVINIKINELVGIRRIRLSNFASSQELDPPNSEVILVVGDHKLYVDKCGLMGCSSIFYEILHKDMDMKTLEIRDVSVAHFLVFIRLIYKQDQQITLENVKSVLELAIRYDVEFLIEDCVQFLVATEKIAISEKLRLAELHKLSALEEEALKQQHALREDTVKVLDLLKEHAVNQVKLFEEAKVEYKNFEQELERMAAEAEERLELIKILQTAKPLGPHEQQIFRTFEAQPPEEPEYYFRRLRTATESIWKEIIEQNTNNGGCGFWRSGPIAEKLKKDISSKLDYFKNEGVTQHRTFWDFVQVMQSGQAHEMIQHIHEEEMKGKKL